MTGAAVHEEPDDGLRLRGEVRLLRAEGVGVVRLDAWGEESLLVEQSGQAEQAGATAGTPEEVTPRQAREWVSVESFKVHQWPRKLYQGTPT
jgi:hypothetical protein